jgi:hypothetical protein
LTKIDSEAINQYLTWLRDKQLYPPQYSPEEYAEWIEMSEARVRMSLIRMVLQNKDLTNQEICDKINDIMEEELEVKLYESE